MTMEGHRGGIVPLPRGQDPTVVVDRGFRPQPADEPDAGQSPRRRCHHRIVCMGTVTRSSKDAPSPEPHNSPRLVRPTCSQYRRRAVAQRSPSARCGAAHTSTGVEVVTLADCGSYPRRQGPTTRSRSRVRIRELPLRAGKRRGRGPGSTSQGQHHRQHHHHAPTSPESIRQSEGHDSPSACRP